MDVWMEAEADRTGPPVTSSGVISFSPLGLIKPRRAPFFLAPPLLPVVVVLDHVQGSHVLLVVRG